MNDNRSEDRPSLSKQARNIEIFPLILACLFDSSYSLCHVGDVVGDDSIPPYDSMRTVIVR